MSIPDVIEHHRALIFPLILSGATRRIYIATLPLLLRVAPPLLGSLRAVEMWITLG